MINIFLLMITQLLNNTLNFLIDVLLNHLFLSNLFLFLSQELIILAIILAVNINLLNDLLICVIHLPTHPLHWLALPKLHEFSLLHFLPFLLFLLFWLHQPQILEQRVYQQRNLAVEQL